MSNHIKTVYISLKSPGQFNEFPGLLKETFRYRIIRLLVSGHCCVITTDVARTLKDFGY